MNNEDKVEIDMLRQKSHIIWRLMINKNVIFDNNVVLKIVSYNAKKQKIFFKYNGQISSTTTEHFLDFDGFKIKKYFENLLFKYNVGENIFDDNRDLLVIDRFKINKKKFYKVKCNICGYTCVVDEYTIKEHDYSCNCCNGNVVVEGVNDISTTAPWMIPYFQGGSDEAKLYTSGSSAELYFNCPYCNKMHDRAIAISSLYSRKRLNCSCMDYISYPEKFMRNFLLINNVDYMYQVGKKIFHWCKNYIYDFYIPNKKIIIETHGDQHYNTSFSNRTLNEQKKIDKEKQTLAELNGFIYIIIDCRKSDAEYIYNQILASKLINLLNISDNKINIKEIDKKCRSNILKEVCNYYKNNRTTTMEIAQKFKLNISTINKYLHVGTELGWCDYIPKNCLIEGQRKTTQIMTNRKKKIYGNIAVYDTNGKLIGEYINQYDAKNKLNDIGIEISVSSIGQALKRDNHKAKNLYFYYTYNNEMEGC